MVNEKDPNSEPGGKQGPPPGEIYNFSGVFQNAVFNIKSTIVGADDIKDIEDLPPEEGDSPFKGLQYFSEQDSALFFGRELLTARIVGRLQQARFLAIIGASGSGKSSLVRAGIIPAIRSGERLADGGLPPTDSGQWAVQVITPTAHPLESLASCLTQDAESINAIRTLQEELAGDSRTLNLAARRYLAQNSKPHLLLVIDQFEEIYTMCRDDVERSAFINNVLDAANPDDLQPISILITLRADFYAHIAQHDRLRQVISQYQEFIGAMTRDELVRAIDLPLAKGNWKIQAGLIEVILDDIGYEPGALPLLSHALLETWKRRRGRTLTLSGYTEAGGVRGAIAQTAESVFKGKLTPEQRPVARMIFLRMAEVSDDATDTRRRASYTELITRSTDELVIDTVIKILADARLVTTDTVQPGGIKVVEVAHEALIREWPTLREWLDDDREGLRLQHQLTEATNDWLNLDQDPGLLFRGARLQQIGVWADEHPDRISLQESDFLEASRKIAAEEAEQARRLKRASNVQRITIAVAVLLIIAVALFAYSRRIIKVTSVPSFDIAVADFGLQEQDGSVSLTTNEIARQYSQHVYEHLSETFSGNPDVKIWRGSLKLAKEEIPIGTVTGQNRSERYQRAAEIASRLNADMLVFGFVDTDQDPVVSSLEFYLTPQDGADYENNNGGFQLPSITSDAANPVSLDDQVSLLGYFATGLNESNSGHSLEAVEAFLEAERYTPESGSEVVEFFIGREYLFLVDRTPILEFARDAFDELAQEAFQKSIEINPDYARAYIGLGGVMFKRAQYLLRQPSAEQDSGEPRPKDLNDAMQLVDGAIDAYNQALLLDDDLPEYGIPVDSVASLGLGNAYRLKGEIHQRQGESQLAMELFHRAIAELKTTLQTFEAFNQTRYLTQAYEYLGTSYQWQGYTYEVEQDYPSSLDAYSQSVEYFDRCIDQGKGSQDVVIKTIIIQNVCTPGRENVQQVIDSLSGG